MGLLQGLHYYEGVFVLRHGTMSSYYVFGVVFGIVSSYVGGHGVYRMLGGLGAALLLVPIKDLARTPLSASESIGSPAYTFVKQGIPYRLRRHRFKNVTGRFRRKRNI